MSNILGALAAARRRNNSDVSVWQSTVASVGGTLAGDSLSIAQGLSNNLNIAPYSSKVVYLLPLLGSNIQAARVPLRDSVGIGPAANSNFVDADFSQSTGLQGNGVNKLFDLILTPSQLGSSGNGAYGYWENNINFGGSASDCPMGCRDDANDSFKGYLGSTFCGMQWGDVAGFFTNAAGASNGHYYFQRSGATLREFYKNGASVASNTSNSPATGANVRPILLMAHSNTAPQYWAGRCAVAYMTNGTLSSTEIASFHTLLGTYLITPTGR